jgi:hypothetical protein
MKKSDASQGQSASTLISQRIVELGDWRGKTLSSMRKLIKEADPDVVEEWKWLGTPVWSHDGILCTGESYKSVVKLTFAKGASLRDPARLFNSSLEGNTRRAIDIREGDVVDEAAFKALVRQAVALNGSGKSKESKTAKVHAPSSLPGKARKPATLPKSDGDAGVQAFIASMEPWQAAIAKRVDALVVKHVPGVRKAVRWRCPFYGVEGQGWFLAFAAFQRHIKFSFFKGASLEPVPPVGKF